MAKFITRRYSDPAFVKALREGILKIASQKQCPNEDRIVRALQNEYEWTKADILKQLKLAVKDGFLHQVTAISSHGSTKGIPQTAYRVRSNELDETLRNKESHDWYCWMCHNPGEVILCDYCPRVFHRRCAHDGTVSGGKWKCSSCQPQKLPPLMNSKTPEELAKMLIFTMDRMKEKAKDFLKPIDTEEYEDYLEYIFKPLDLSLLEKRVTQKCFKTPKEFREEAQWMLHNSIIYFGEDADMTDLAEAIMEDCDGELEEMVRCPDCYLMSNIRTNNWFTKPCYFPHELVWAKMTGEPPWPAKLLSWDEDKSKALVRFFGTAHQRAWVASKNITPITQKPEVKKRPQRWMQAIDEMKLYQRQLNQLENNMNTVKKTPLNQSQVDEKSTQTDEKETHPDKRRKLDSELELNKVTEVRKELEKQAKENAEIIRKKDERICILQDHAKTLEEHLSSAVMNLEGERNRAKQLKQKLEMMEKEISRNKNIIEMPNHVILNGSASRERELEVNDKMVAPSDSQKDLEREIKEAVKRAVNKERLEKERAIEDAVKRTKREKEKQIEKSLQVVRNEAEKSLQEAIQLTKRKQWCAYCSKEAFYPCCWNTSYCTVDCQKAHWCSHRFQCMRLACNCGTRECVKSC
ncbi:zinc finger MYND domain-containing protein 11-like [Actinia tenebrosa]|uniref:Zinc finger MYND domain-containing protein 11-like n=1 Tax=Actinia tenebrosa TaxID=6105 RepID=A0A6P8HHD0_ACTTE|nr:zinc finger MYND domain-containing protein 11-like [Actinia tenebrosa]